jgi:hypothetical protein
MEHADVHNRMYETGNYGMPKGPTHSVLIPNSLMSGHHFLASAFTSAPSASGVCRSRGKIRHLAFRERFYEGLRRAGTPEE